MIKTLKLLGRPRGFTTTWNVMDTKVIDNYILEIQKYFKGGSTKLKKYYLDQNFRNLV